MLVLSRKQNETIVLPDLGITIRVIGVTGGRVRLGVEGPREVSVVRREILNQAERPCQAVEHCAAG